jgi:endoribonuclease LACTB2
VRHYAEGDVLTRWQGEPVRLLAVPGHDEGQLAPMPESRAWCIVGDLMQGVGTVVIAPPEGDMRKYFATLRRIIDLDPQVIIPSHGLALGGTHYLQQALAHREQREREVHARHEAGMGEDQMLAEIYRGVDPRLLPLARLNIRSHLAKLREEGAIR